MEDMPYSKLKKILSVLGSSFAELESDMPFINGSNNNYNACNNLTINEIKLVEELIASKKMVIETKDALLASKHQEIEHYKQEIARLRGN
jgi:hypothetical protein